MTETYAFVLQVDNENDDWRDFVHTGEFWSELSADYPADAILVRVEGEPGEAYVIVARPVGYEEKHPSDDRVARFYILLQSDWLTEDELDLAQSAARSLDMARLAAEESAT